MTNLNATQSQIRLLQEGNTFPVLMPVDLPEKAKVLEVIENSFFGVHAPSNCNGRMRVEYIEKGKRMDDFVLCPHQQGEIVGFREEWRFVEFDEICPSIEFRDGSILKFEDIWGYTECWPKWTDELWHKQKQWQSPETMPSEFIRCYGKVTEVQCKKLRRMTLEDYRMAGCPCKDQEPCLNGLIWFLKEWNNLHPDHPYSPDRHVFQITFEPCEKE